jgi:hypothetical protein
MLTIRDHERYIEHAVRSTRPYYMNWPICTWGCFGVGTGGNERRLLKLMPRQGQLYGFDAWEGLPEAWNGHRVGHFKFVAPPALRSDARVRLVDGWFRDTIPEVDATVMRSREWDLVHVDCDCYSSAKDVLELVTLTPGTIVMFDELFGYAGWREHEWRALEESGIEYEWVAWSPPHRATIRVR